MQVFILHEAIRESVSAAHLRGPAAVYRGIAGEPLSELRCKFIRIANKECGAVGHRLTAALEGIRDGGKARFRRGARDVLLYLTRSFSQAARVFRREDDQGGIGRRSLMRRLWSLFENNMSIRAAKSERADAGSQGQLRAIVVEQATPVLCFRRQIKRRTAEVDVRILLGEVKIPRQRTVFHRQNGLEQSSHACRAFQMPDVRFHRAKCAVRQRRRGIAAFPIKPVKGQFQTIDFDRIAQRSPGPMRFDVADSGGIDVRILIGAHQQVGLRHGIRSGERIRPARVILPRRLDDGVNCVSIFNGATQRFQQYSADSFAAHISVSIAIEGLAAAVPSEHSGLVECRERGWRQQNIHTARDCHLALAAADCVHRAMHRDERAGAGGVDRFAGAAQVEQERDAVGRHRVREPGGHVCLDRQPAGLNQLRVVVGAHADKEAGAAAGESGRVVTGVLDRLPHGFKEETLLRVHEVGFARRDMKEGSVEPVHLGQEAATNWSSIHGRPQLGAICRRFGNQVSACLEISPESIEVG